MHFGVIAFRACGVYLPSHFLCYESEFLAYSVLVFVHCLAEVVQVVCQSLFLLADVQLLDVVYQFLFKSVLVIFHLGYACQSVDDALAYLFHSRLLVWFDFSQQFFDIVNLLLELPLQGGTFLSAECQELFQCVVYALSYPGPFLVGQFLYLRPCHHVRHAQNGGEDVLWLWNAGGGYNVAYLFIVGFHQLLVYRRGVRRRVFLRPDGEIHLSSF